MVPLHPRLLDGAWEAVEDEAAFAVVVLDPLLDDTDHQLVAHLVALGVRCGAGARGGLGLALGLGLGLGLG